MNMKTNDYVFVPLISPRPVRVLSSHEGGFGRVFVIEAYDMQKYAIKTLKWDLGLDRQQLREEALKLAGIPHHPNVIDILGIEWIEESPYIILPWCKSTLADVMGKRLGGEMISRYAHEMATGLAFLHDKLQVLHLDLKPANVLIDKDGKCLLSDFGLSRCFPKPALTGLRHNVFVSGVTGTIAYMSPEHFLTNRLSAKSDVFALGIILYEMLYSKHPFLKSTMEATVRSILRDEPRFSFFDRTGVIEKLCRQCLAKNPDDRPHAKDIVHSLQTGFGIEAAIAPSFDLPGTINRAGAYINASEPKKAEELLLLCLRHRPWSLHARVNLAEMYLLSNQSEKAVTVAREALDLAPWCPEERYELPTLLSNLAYLYLNREPHQALIYAREALSLSPDDWQACANAAEACRLLAEGQTAKRDQFLTEGFSYVNRALSLNPKDLTSQIIYGNLLLLKLDFAILSPLVVKIMNSAGGDNVPARVLFIRTLTATNQLDDAEQWLQPMMRFKPLESLANQLKADIDRKRIQ